MLAVEGVAAALQIFLADVPPEDLCLVRGSTEITVESTTEEMVSIERKGPGREWVLKYPITKAKSADDATERQKRLAGCVCEVVGDFSLLKSERFLEVLDRLFGNGLREKLFAVNPYEEVLKEYSAEGNFAREGVKVAQQPHQEFTPKVGLRELEWPDGPGPGYAPQLAKQHVDNRYRIYRESVRYTLQRLAKSSSFRATVNALRGKGWRDWHVLTAVSGIVLNRRAKAIAGEGSDPETVKKIYRELLSRLEREDDPLVPDSEFTVDKMKLILEMSMLATLDTLGLCYPRREIVDFEQIADFLGKRYNYWNDDTPHQDLFSSK
jgi:hypothetical protein